ncbi:MAG: FAD-dependent monooxygenase [Pseudomonadota bacterium]
MERIETDILVVGGGIAGLIATAVFAAKGHRTLCIDPKAVPQADNAAGADLRSTAFLMPAVTLLQDAGLWDGLKPHAAPLRLMRILDAGGRENRVRHRADFLASEIGQEVFGWNIPNWRLRREIAARLGDLPGAQLRAAGFRAILPRLKDAVVTLSDGAQVSAGLVVAADGRGSPLRQALDIPVTRLGYRQKAVVFVVQATEPHDDVSTEIHRTGGPFTLVPLPDHDGAPHAAVVWMEDGPTAAALAEMPSAQFEAALNERACGVMGRLSLVGRRAVWPIVSQLARRFDGPRVALIGEAAHVMPPIGAQGLNTSLADVRCLADLIEEARAAGEDIASPARLARYTQRRWPDAALRLAGVDALNRASQSSLQPLRDLRGLGLRVLHDLRPLRRMAMRAGMNTA